MAGGIIYGFFSLLSVNGSMTGETMLRLVGLVGHQIDLQSEEFLFYIPKPL
jgi:hypothetical protein